MILQIFRALVSESEPPNTVKSCANTYTRRPSTRPKPVMKPSPGGRWSSIPKSSRAVGDKFVELFKRAFIEQQRDAFARRQLAGLVLALAAFRAAAGFRFGAAAAQLF